MLRSGRRWWPPPLTVSLTVKYPFFFDDFPKGVLDMQNHWLIRFWQSMLFWEVAWCVLMKTKTLWKVAVSLNLLISLLSSSSCSSSYFYLFPFQSFLSIVVITLNILRFKSCRSSDWERCGSWSGLYWALNQGSFGQRQQEVKKKYWGKREDEDWERSWKTCSFGS